MRHGTAALLALLLLVAAALPVAAQAMTAAERFPTDGPDLARSMRIAEKFWGKRPCGGRVELRWGDLHGTTRAEARWMNAYDAWNRPRRNFDCSITFNNRLRFNPKGLCSTVVHEVGHLLGKRHSHSRRSVMYEFESAPLRECGGSRRTRESRSG